MCAHVLACVTLKQIHNDLLTVPAANITRARSFYLGGPSLWTASIHTRLISKENFVGCIENVKIGAAVVNLQDPVESRGTSRDCEDESANNYCNGDTCGVNGTCVSLYDRYRCECIFGITGNSCNETASTTTLRDGRSVR